MVPDGNELEQDPVGDLLAPFSLALANATYSGRLSRTTEEAIAQSDDTWSTAQLVHTGRFGKEFLLDVFEKGVVQRISDDSRYNLIASDPPLGDSFTLGTYWGTATGLAVRHQGARPRRARAQSGGRGRRRSRPT